MLIQAETWCARERWCLFLPFEPLCSCELFEGERWTCTSLRGLMTSGELVEKRAEFVLVFPLVSVSRTSTGNSCFHLGPRASDSKPVKINSATTRQYSWVPPTYSPSSRWRCKISYRVISTRPAALCKNRTEYMADTFLFTFPFSRVIMAVNLLSSDISGSDFLDLLHIYLVTLAARASAFLFFYPLLNCLSLNFDSQDAVLTWIAGLRTWWACPCL